MDIELLKSTPDDQIEMMMMMQMNKSGPPGSYTDTTPLISFSGGGCGGGGGGDGSMAHHFNSLSNSSPTSLHPHVTTISFSNNNNNNNNNACSNNMLLPTSLASYPNIDNNHTTRENNNNNYDNDENTNTNNNNNNNTSCYGPFSSGTSTSKQTSMAAMREMIFRIAAMQPIYIDPEAVKPPKRRNVRISKDPQSVAARHRRERISERIRILQRLVPGGTKMDTASMLDEAIHYVKFLKTQVQSLERVAAINNRRNILPQPPLTTPGLGYFPMTARGGTSHDVHQFSDA